MGNTQNTPEKSGDFSKWRIVRDKMGKVFSDSKKVSLEMQNAYLRVALFEHASEAALKTTEYTLLKELADIMEIIEALLEINEIPQKKLLLMADVERNNLGGYKEGYVIPNTEKT